MSVLHSKTEKIEQISIDEAFLDATDLTENPFTFGRSLQKEIYQSCQLPASLGIASNKLVAKIATDVGKASVKTTTYPNAIQIVPAGEEANFLAPLPIEMLWGVGPKTAERLASINIFTIGELAAWPQADLAKRFGKSGFDLHRRAQGIDNRDIVTHREPKSFSQEVTFGKDISDRTRLLRQIRKQSEQLARSLSKANQAGSTIKLKLRWPDFTTISRQTTIQIPTNDFTEIYGHAVNLFDQNWDGKTPVRLIGVGVAQLQAPGRQLSLWEKTDFKKLAKIESALYQVKQRFGEQSISKGIIPSEDEESS